MTKSFIHIAFLFLAPMLLIGQSVTFGSGTTFKLGQRTTFTTGGNAIFLGTFTIGDSSATIAGDAVFDSTLINDGTIISGGDIDFGNNQNVGSLKFIGSGDQTITGDTLFIENLEVDKTGNVIVATDQIYVAGSLDVTSGVVQTDDIDDLIVTGASSEAGTGYVEGTLVGQSTGDAVSFPMGISGFKNAITLSDTQAGTTIIVDCLVPDPEQLFPSEDMVGIADEVEWQIRTKADSTEAIITANFSGLDFTNFSNGENLRGETYTPALVIYQKEDTIYSILSSSEATPKGVRDRETSGRVVSITRVMLDTAVTRVNVALLPEKDGAEVFVPNVFSPEGFYEENRVFRPFFAGGIVTSVNMRVFNAYNEEVYRYSESGTDLDLSLMGWDGTLGAGQPAEEGVYYYQITVISPNFDNPEEGVKVGSVLLVK